MCDGGCVSGGGGQDARESGWETLWPCGPDAQLTPPRSAQGASSLIDPWEISPIGVIECGTHPPLYLPHPGTYASSRGALDDRPKQDDGMRLQWPMAMNIQSITRSLFEPPFHLLHSINIDRSSHHALGIMHAGVSRLHPLPRHSIILTSRLDNSEYMR